MPKAFWLPLWAGLFAAVTVNAGTIQFQVSNTGTPGTFQYTYLLSGFNFGPSQELLIDFPVSVYSSISNGAPVAGYDVELFGVNVPPGTDGDYTSEALEQSPPLTGPFTVDFTLVNGQQPGPQQFEIFQLDQNGDIEQPALPGGGVTTAAVPEPASFTLAALGLAVGSVLWIRRRS
jgi:hypothetical protein